MYIFLTVSKNVDHYPQSRIERGLEYFANICLYIELARVERGITYQDRSYNNHIRHIVSLTRHRTYVLLL